MILKFNPIPDNVQKVLVMDEYMKEVIMMTGKEGKLVLARDKALSKIQEAILKSLGPLGRLFEAIELWKKSIVEDPDYKTTDKNQSLDAVTYF